MHLRVSRSEGGLDGFAEKHKLRRQTPYEWAAGTRQPNLSTLRAWADALGVSRAEMVAAMDASPSDAVRGLSEARVVALAGEIGAEVAAALSRRLPLQPDEASPDAENPPVQGTRQPVQPQSNGQ